MVRDGGSAAGAAPLSFGEERTAVRQCHGQLRAPRAPGRSLRAAAPAADPGHVFPIWSQRCLKRICAPLKDGQTPSFLKPAGTPIP